MSLDFNTWTTVRHWSKSMMTSSNGNIFRVTGPLWGKFTGRRVLPHTKASDAELWGFFNLRLNKRFSKRSWGWWFETQSRSLWRYYNAKRCIKITLLYCLLCTKGLSRPQFVKLQLQLYYSIYHNICTQFCFAFCFCFCFVTKLPIRIIHLRKFFILLHEENCIIIISPLLVN